MNTNPNGFTLIEVMITLLVLTTGLTALSSMQIKAMQSNKSAFSRSAANCIALSILEELKRTTSDQQIINIGTNLNAGKAEPGKSPDPKAADHCYNPKYFPSLKNLLQVKDGKIQDHTGIPYQIFYNVQANSIQVGSTTYTPSYTLRLFIYWSSFSSKKHMETTIIIPSR